ncbi:manganese peroxidase 2 [Sistotremastrum suecicum HHB10207 ss-3]|uniref:Peroxidase n=1 Tax=Sistotremastrum suecicum HHB10207 ss-3 TaxID=1314776 RepID=A0A166FQM0_9AGAM|nr:manganese peroxidase 2 [Sistotremastrum suecicum HHB10207 ss-3]
MAFGISVILLAFATAVQAASYKRVACPDGVHTASHQACCAFFALRDDLQENLFDNTCGEDVHESLRLTFHDAIGFSASGKFKGTGADGSMIIFDEIETAFPANNGIDDSVDALSPFLATHNVTAGDLIQFAGAVGITNCPGAPRLQFLAGRPNALIPADIGTVPEPQDSVNSIFARMADAGFSPNDLIHLLASHSIARADHVDPSIQAVPFDSTPFTFDTQIFLEVLLKGTGVPGTPGNLGESLSPLPAEGELRLLSDFALARDPRTACTWQGLINQQEKMAANFAEVMSRLAVVGQNTRKLVDCSEVIPIPKPAVKKPATYPATKTFRDIEKACPSPFPILGTDRGAQTKIPACPNGDVDIEDCSD